MSQTGSASEPAAVASMGLGTGRADAVSVKPQAAPHRRFASSTATPFCTAADEYFVDFTDETENAGDAAYLSPLLNGQWPAPAGQHVRQETGEGGFLGSVSESGGISLPASQAALFLPPNVHDIRPAFSKFFDNSQRLGPMIPLTGGELPLSAALATPAQQPLFPVVNFPSQLNAGALTGALNADEMTVIDVMDAADFIAIPADKSGESELTLQSPNFWTGSQSGSSTSWTGESPAIETEQAFPTASGADQQIVVKVKEEPRDEDQDAEMAPLDSEDSDYRPTKRPRNSSGEVHSKAAKPKKPRNRSKESAASEDLGSTTASLASSSQTAATKRRKPARNPSEVVSARTLANTARTLFSTAVGNLTADEKEKCYNAIFAKRAKNTEAARRSRERKREYVEELENRVKELEEEVQRYKIERREMEEMISQLQVASS